MARGITTALKNQLKAPSLHPVLFAEITTTAEDPVRVWTGTGTIAWAGHDWLGVGDFGKISSISESTDIRADGIKLSLSGIPSDMITMALDEIQQGLPVSLWLAAITDANPPAIVADPFACYVGRADAVDVLDDAQTCTIELSVENRLIDLQRPRGRRYTHEDQQIEYPGDLGFEYVDSIQEMNVIWGRSTPIPIMRPPTDEPTPDTLIPYI